VFSGLWDIHYANKLQSRPARYILGDWQLSSIIQASSGRVYSDRIGQDLNNDGNLANERVPYAPRNSLRLPAFATIDLRVAKDVPLWREARVRLKLIGEAFNLTRSNEHYRTTVFATHGPRKLRIRRPAYLFDTSAGDPRILQLALVFSRRRPASRLTSRPSCILPSPAHSPAVTAESKSCLAGNRPSVPKFMTHAE
jgi:hypothetical protein